MQKNTLVGAALLVLAAVSTPADAYHIVSPVANTWNLSIPFMIICESDGPTDPRNPNPIAAHGGVGGLCTSGLNWVTCGSCVPTAPPLASSFSLFDLADSSGNTNTIGYDVEIGVTFCNVLPHEQVRYREIYAWLSYDLASPRHLKPSPDFLFDPRTSDDFEEQMFLASGIGGAGFHGHVAAYVDLTTSTDTAGRAVAATGSTGGTTVCGATDPLADTPVHLI